MGDDITIKEITPKQVAEFDARRLYSLEKKSKEIQISNLRHKININKLKNKLKLAKKKNKISVSLAKHSAKAQAQSIATRRALLKAVLAETKKDEGRVLQEHGNYYSKTPTKQRFI